MKDSLNCTFAFGDFRLDLAERVLRHGETVLTLRPKLFELLVFFVENNGTVLGKEKIIRNVWGELNLGTPDNPSANLNVTLSSLRKTLGDDPDRPRYIETLPRRGYRFIAPVEIIENVHADEAEFPEGLPVVRAVVEPARLTPVELAGPPVLTQAEKRRPNFSLMLGAMLFGAFVMAGIFLLTHGASLPGAERRAEQTAQATTSPTSAATPTGWLEPDASIRIDGMQPAQPNATIGDQRLVLKGLGFQSGQTVTVTFPGGGAGVLSGAQIEAVTSDSCAFWLDFNGNPGAYNLRVNHPDGRFSPWFNFAAAPLIEEPQIGKITVIASATPPYGCRVAVEGKHFQQNVQVFLERADGKFEVFGTPQVQRASPRQFDLLLAASLQPGVYKLQARNANGRVSNVTRFRVAEP